MTARVRVADGSGTGPDPLRAADEALAAVGGLEGRRPDLAVVFLGAAYAEAAGAVAQRVRARLGPRHLIGVTAGAVVGGSHELERADCLAVWAASLPGAELVPLSYGPALTDPDEAGEGWRLPPEDAAVLLLLADPFSFPADGFLAWLRQARPGLPVCGGLASAASAAGGNRLLLDDEVTDRGAVAVAIAGDVRVRTLVSQGCRPVGDSYVVTRADRNLLQELAGEPPVARLRETFHRAPAADRELMRHGLHLGTVIDEYRDDFGRGDFLVRGILGADPDSGALAVGDVMRVGQTVRFHVRDAGSADEDLRALLDEFAAGRPPPAGALLFTCNGRGTRLFGRPDHDAGLVREALGGTPLAGLHCAGEFGPVGGRSFLHGFTASVMAVEEAGA